LTILAIVFLLPFIWMVSTSLKGQGQIFVYPPNFIPSPVLLGNYPLVFDKIPMWHYFLNTIFYASAVTVGQLAFCSLAGYVFARLTFPGRDLLFALYLATMMIPASVTIVPSYILMRTFGWVNTVQSMTIPGMLGSAFGTFLLRQFFMTIPKELDEAATIDGAGPFRIFWQIILPLAKPALTVLAIFTVLYVWNDFVWPLIMLRDEKLYTLTLGLARFGGPGYQAYTDWPLVMAAATLSTIPLLLIFLFTQRFFIRGIALTGISGR
jgi:multiple sugar transport system permease protein